MALHKNETLKSNKTCLYTVNSSKNHHHLGWFIFSQKTTIEKKSYGDLDGVIEINIDFIPPNIGCTHRLNQFFGSISSKSYSKPRASISKSTADSGFGGIYLEPIHLNGHRIGGLVMDTIINWLKQFDGSTIVNSIRYKPSKGQENIVEAFYKKFSIPLSGETTISNLTTSDSWKKNIFEYDIEDIFYEVWESKSSINFYTDQNEYFKSISEKIEIELTTWSSIIFGKPKYNVDNISTPLNKNLKYYQDLDKIKKSNDLKDIVSLIEEYKKIKGVLSSLKEKNNNLKNKISNLNNKNIKKLKLRLAFEKIFFNANSFWFFIILLIIFNNLNIIKHLIESFN